jgi:hypothetical protein
VSYKLPKSHLSPSQIGQWSRCEQQYAIFTIGGAKSPPDFVLEAKRLTHEVLLEHDLAQKITTNHNLANNELSEIHRSIMDIAEARYHAREHNEERGRL